MPTPTEDRPQTEQQAGNHTAPELTGMFGVACPTVYRAIQRPGPPPPDVSRPGSAALGVDTIGPTR